MLIRKLAPLSFGLLLAGPALAAPVDMTHTTTRPIILISEATPCTGPASGAAGVANADCYVAGDSGGVFPAAAALPAAISFSGNIATITIDHTIWEAALSAALNDDGGTPGDPSDDLTVVVGSVSDYVFTINTTTGAAASYSWTGTLFSGALNNNLPLSVSLLAGTAAAGDGNGSAFFGTITGPPAVAFACDTGGFSPPSTGASCVGQATLANQVYNPATGTIVALAGSSVIVGLTPLAWAPLDVQLLEAVPEPGTVLLLGAGLFGLGLIGRRRA